MNKLDIIRAEIRESGYLSASQIKLRIAKYNMATKELNKFLKSIVCDDISCIKYTNTYVAGLKVKLLYYYNPNKKRKKWQKKK